METPAGIWTSTGKGKDSKGKEGDARMGKDKKAGIVALTLPA